jgi:hypothetical protein
VGNNVFGLKSKPTAGGSICDINDLAALYELD